MAKDFNFTIKNPTDTPEKIAEKINSLTSAIDTSAIKGDIITKSILDERLASINKSLSSKEDRVNYNMKNGRKTLSDMRYHGSGTGGVATLTGDITGSGTSSIVTTLATVNGNVGSFTNASITVNGKGLITAASSGSSTGMTWNNVSGTSQSAAINNGYITNNVSLCTVTLPSTAAVGSIVAIVGNGAGGWLFAQNASQVVNFGNAPTTTGTGGSLASVNRYDCVEVICTVANTTWTVRSSVGNLTIT
jgi:hypothetical protein